MYNKKYILCTIKYKIQNIIGEPGTLTSNQKITLLGESLLHESLILWIVLINVKKIKKKLKENK